MPVAQVLFLILDAFDPARLSPRLTPNLWRWANEAGAAAGTGRAVMAACTYPNHATFVTGRLPDEHGLHINHVVAGGQVRGAWEVGPRGETVFERLSHLATAAVLGDHHLVGVMGARGAGGHWPPDGDISGVAPLDLLGYPADEAVLAPLLSALEGQPDLLVGYFGSIDTFSHVYGPGAEEVTVAYRHLDEKVGMIDQALAPNWDDWIVVVVSDHIQDTVSGPGIDLRAALDGEALVVDEGSAALVAGPIDPGRVSSVEGVSGWRQLSEGMLLAWCQPGRYFGSSSEPVFKGVHGGEHTRTQLALVTGGHGHRLPLAQAVRAGQVPASYWADAICAALGR